MSLATYGWTETSAERMEAAGYPEGVPARSTVFLRAKAEGAR